MTDNFFDGLFDNWKKYFHYHVAGNEHLEKPLFHSLLGVILSAENTRVCYLSTGYRSVRIPIIMIQPSGTGKSEGMGCYNNLVISISYKLKLGILTELTTKMTDAGLLGSIDSKGKQIFGALSNINVIFWDEGSVLFRDDNFTRISRDILQMALDEKGGGKGFVSKRLGSSPEPIKYYSCSTLVAGSYLSPDMNNSILKEGFFQRIFPTYKTYTYDELKKMRRDVMHLKSIDILNDVNPIIEKITNQIKNLLEFCKINYSKRGKVMYIDYDSKKLDIFSDMLESVIDEKTKDKYPDYRQDILNTFSGRDMLFADRFASQHAILFKKSEVEEDDYKYGCELVGQRIDGVISILDKVGIIEDDKNKNLEEILTKVVGEHLGINHTILVNLLTTSKIYGWNLRYNDTVDFITKAEKKGIIIWKDGPKNAKLYYLPDLKPE